MLFECIALVNKFYSILFSSPHFFIVPSPVYELWCYLNAIVIRKHIRQYMFVRIKS